MTKERRIRGNSIEIAPILDAIPAYKELPTGVELYYGSKQLINEYPQLVASGFLHLDENFGRSTEGRAIELMTIGKGKNKTLWIGTPHPNEPIGTLTIEFLSRYLCKNPEITEQLDTTFVFIKNADPDGLAHNESWLKRDLDPLRYALGFYRSTLDEQIDWAFPIDYKKWHFNNSPAEVHTLIKAFRMYQPRFYFPLHNFGLGNTLFYLSGDLPQLYPLLTKVVNHQGLSIHTGDPEAPFYEKYADGFFRLPTAEKYYDYYTKGKEETAAADKIQGGIHSAEYLQDLVPESISIFPEVPYFTADALEDNTPSGISRRNMLLEEAKARGNISGYMAAQFDVLKDKLPDSRLKRAAEKRIELMKGFTSSLIKEADKPEYQKEATKAEVYKAVQVGSFYEIIQLGQVYRLALQAGEIAQAEGIKKYIEDIIDKINDVSPIRTIPLQKLVAIQIGAGLLVQQQLALGA